MGSLLTEKSIVCGMEADSFAEKKDTKTRLFKSSIPELNQYYRQVVEAYTLGDTRAVYLDRFEFFLSLSIRTPLWQTPTYLRINRKYPLNPVNGFVSRDFYKLRILMYEQIMRENGLAGGDRGGPSRGQGIEVFDLSKL